MKGTGKVKSSICSVGQLLSDVDKYFVFDYETQTAVKAGRKASPWHPDNFIVAAGWKRFDDDKCAFKYSATRADNMQVDIPHDVRVIVGHNIKFDLLWMWDNKSLKDFFKRGGWVWDTQYVEYLLCGQQQKAHMNSLAETSVKYGVAPWKDAIKELWDLGKNTSEIPSQMLTDYLVGTDLNGGDVGNTEKVFLGQVKKVCELGIISAIKYRMDGLCATTEMEYNGIKVDLETAVRNAKLLAADIDTYYADMIGMLDLPEGLTINFGSSKQVSSVLFGGEIQYTVKVPDGHKKVTTKTPMIKGTPVKDWDGKILPEFDTYRSGKRKGECKFTSIVTLGDVKYKKESRSYIFKGFTTMEDTHALKKDGQLVTDSAGYVKYSTAAEVLDLVNGDHAFIKVFQKWRAAQKDLGTYYVTKNSKGEVKGMLTFVDPDTRIIHHNLNHTSTVTGRLSATKPNMQNLPRGDKSRVKEMFVSRYGDAGRMYEIDYSQLEVVIQGVMSGDANMIADLNRGVDFHCVRVSAKCHITYEEALVYCKDEHNSPDYKKWKAERTACKEFSFQRAYGAGVAALCASTGMSREEVQALIDAENARYPSVAKFYTMITNHLNATATTFYDPEYSRQFRRGFWKSAEGTIYCWRTYPTSSKFQKARGIEDDFALPEIMNYPIQGGGGMVVQTQSGRVWRELFLPTDNFNGQLLMVNTVHDCVWFDGVASVGDLVIPYIKYVLEDVATSFPELNVRVPFPVEAEGGVNMYRLEHI